VKPIQTALTSIVICGTALASAHADQARTPSVPPKHPVPLESYATDNPSCLEWTNGCTICSKGEMGKAACSTPGIACQPGGIQCKKKAP